LISGFGVIAPSGEFTVVSIILCKRSGYCFVVG
jgi:hypothetical protein